tara:strand:+ start:122 stop:1792 length:1671 start_codon:yes stop_codon:yes gene_type:complete
MNNKFKFFDSDSLKDIHKRLFFSITIFTLVYFIVFYRIADVMIFNKILVKITKDIETNQRGNIYDRNNILLASSIENYSFAINAQKIQDNHCNYTISKKLETILSIPKEQIQNKLLKDSHFVWIKRNISPREHQQIINLGEIGLRLEKENNRRIYPLENITSHVVGYTNIDGKGQSGIEKGLNKRLSKGIDINLSIDARIQESTHNELIKTIKKFSADSGLSIILNIKSGEILSMISYPDFNPNNKKSFSKLNLFNKALQGNYEMGSTFKPITIAMGLSQKIINNEMTFDVSKPIRQGKYTIEDFEPYNGKLDIKGIIVNSSNIGTAKIAKKIGQKNQKSFFKKIGFYDKIKIEINESATPLANRNNWGILETMTIAYGHGFAVTPLHLARAYATLVNDGYFVNPTLLLNIKKNITDNKIIENSTSKEIRELLRAVVTDTDYTGPRVRIEGYEIGAKTGTAELIDSGKYNENANRTAFISIFPSSDPEFLVLAIIENPKKIKEENFSITAATVVAPLVKNIILKMIKIIGIPQLSNKKIIKANLDNNITLKNNVAF